MMNIIFQRKSVDFCKYPHQLHRLGIEGKVGAGKEKDDAARYCEHTEE